mmetsp:Transcript_42659/g.121618  ORF Transcript_42659/g.121618 Transcript_42659/m.121618 type:complete len:258 (-) Transcript_42659:661-1434(-)
MGRSSLGEAHLAATSAQVTHHGYSVIPQVSTQRKLRDHQHSPMPMDRQLPAWPGLPPFLPEAHILEPPQEAMAAENRGKHAPLRPVEQSQPWHSMRRLTGGRLTWQTKGTGLKVGLLEGHQVLLPLRVPAETTFTSTPLKQTCVSKLQESIRQQRPTLPVPSKGQTPGTCRSRSPLWFSTCTGCWARYRAQPCRGRRRAPARPGPARRAAAQACGMRSARRRCAPSSRGGRARAACTSLRRNSSLRVCRGGTSRSSQ